MTQLEFDFETAEQTERAEFERVSKIRDHLVKAGVTAEIQIRIVCYAATNWSRHESATEGDRLLVLKSEQALAAELGFSKPGVNRGLRVLSELGLVSRGRGCFVVEWGAVQRLKRDMPQFDCASTAPWIQGKKDLDPNQPTRPDPDLLPGRNRWPQICWFEGGAGLPMFALDGRISRSGMLAIHAGFAELGCVEPTMEAFSTTVALALFAKNEAGKRGIRSPVRWFAHAMAHGPSKTESWPDGELIREAMRRIKAGGVDRHFAEPAGAVPCR